MNFDLTEDQRAFQQTIEQFAREIVAPRAAGIDKVGVVTDGMRARAGVTAGG